MSNNTKALKSGIWYTAANFLTKSMGLITTPIFTRLLTKADFGAYSNYTSWLSIFGILLTLNLGATLISARFDFEDTFDEYISSSIGLNLLLVGTGTIVLNSIYPLIAHKLGMERIYLNCMLVYVMLNSVIELFQIRERYEFRYKISVLVSLLVSAATAFTSVLLVTLMTDKLRGRIFGATIPILLIGSVILVYLLACGKHVRVRYWKYALPIALPFIPHLLSMSLLGSMDRIMITNLRGTEENALYTLAYTCGSLIGILVVSMNTAYSPWLGHKLNENAAPAFQEIRSFSRIYIGIFVFACIGIMLVTPEVLLLLGGERYTEAKNVMPPVTCGVSFQFLYTMFVNVEQYKKKTVGMAIASVTAALLNYGLNALLIPRYGYIAAAYTTLAGYLWLLFAHMYLVKRIGYQHVYDYRFVGIVIAVMLLMTCGVNAAYHFPLLRYGILLLYAVIAVLLLLKYGKKLLHRYRDMKKQ